MSTEKLRERDRRAAVHAALGDPGRLAIIDALVSGDTSPSRLGAALGMASNLLAHHLGVLEQVGVVRRARSEGDRRRSYLTLVPGALDGLNPAASVTAPRIVFVCTENAARSQLAATVWAAHSPVPAASAGTHPAAQIHPGALATAAPRHTQAAGALHRGRPPVAGGQIPDVVAPPSPTGSAVRHRAKMWHPSIPPASPRGPDIDLRDRARRDRP